MKNTPRQKKDDLDDLMKDYREMLRAITPGEVLARDFVTPSGLTPEQMMKKTGMPIKNIVQIIESKRPITPAIALLFERCFGWSAQELVACQTHYALRVGSLQLKIRSNSAKFYVKALEWHQVFAKMCALLHLPDEFADEFAPQRSFASFLKNS
jgi:addiction module HigA family antidote